MLNKVNGTGPGDNFPVLETAAAAQRPLPTGRVGLAVFILAIVTVIAVAIVDAVDIWKP